MNQGRSPETKEKKSYTPDEIREILGDKLYAGLCQCIREF